MKSILIGISGASGSIYAIRLLRFLDKTDVTVSLVVSHGAKDIIKHENDITYEEVYSLADVVYENNDLFAGPASGSFPLDGMVIVPCSMKTLSAIAHGYADTLMTRASTCMLKEKKPLILIPRETPIDFPGLQNMMLCHQAGAQILPAMPGFYHHPKTLDDLVDFIVGKILDQLRIPHNLYQRWK
jgi:flavin prenyltransferase